MVTRADRQFRTFNLNSFFPSIGSGLVTYDISRIQQGTEYNQRFGRKVIIDYVDILGTLVGGQNNSIADDPYNTVCMALVINAPGSAPTGWDLASPLGPQVTAGLKKVLWMKRVVINTNAKDSTGYIANAKVIRVRVPVHESFEYVSTADTVATNQSLYLVMFSDSVAVTNPGFNSGFAMIAFH